jgi:hypothetical protein
MIYSINTSIGLKEVYIDRVRAIWSTDFVYSIRYMNGIWETIRDGFNTVEEAIAFAVDDIDEMAALHAEEFVKEILK